MKIVIFVTLLLATLHYGSCQDLFRIENIDRGLTLSGSANQPSQTLSGSLSKTSGPITDSLGLSHTLNGGSSITAGTGMNIYNTKPHNVDVNAFHTHNIPNHGPNFGTTGGGLSYKHDLGHELFAKVQHTPRFDQTDAKVGARYNFYEDQNTKFNIEAGRSQSFTPWGNTRPNDYVGLFFNKKFK